MFGIQTVIQIISKNLIWSKFDQEPSSQVTMKIQPVILLTSRPTKPNGHEFNTFLAEVTALSGLSCCVSKENLKKYFESENYW